MVKRILLAGMLAMATDVMAEGSYLEASGLYHMASVDVYRFSHLATQVRYGYYVQPQISIEIHGAIGHTSDTKPELKSTLDHTAGLDARFESPPRDGVKAFLSFGYAHTQLTLKRNGKDFPGEGTFEGLSLGGGFEIKPQSFESLSFFSKYSQFYRQDRMRITGVNVGARYEF